MHWQGALGTTYIYSLAYMKKLPMHFFYSASLTAINIGINCVFDTFLSLRFADIVFFAEIRIAI